MEFYRYIPGTVPLIVSIPHTGTYVPPAILDRLTPEAKHLPDTDWHVDRLYAFASELGAHLLMATHSRYVVDLNRAPDDASLYPGKFTTGLCPTTLFDGSPLYREGMVPDAAEVAERIAVYWKPYHDKLTELTRTLKNPVLFDAHSICSQVSTLFEGTLPDLNFGTADGVTMKSGMVEELLAVAKASQYSTVLNGRFKGGYITRHYGQRVQAVQLELAQKNYMDETHPYAYDTEKTGSLQKTLRPLLGILAAHAAR